MHGKSIKAVIFDMDGLLVDTEPLWRKAESEIFSDYGLPVTTEMAHQTTGLRVDAVIAHWQQYFNKPHLKTRDIERRIIYRLVELIMTGIEMLPGVAATIQFLQNKNIPLALASSSHNRIIETVLKVTGLKDNFMVIQSGYRLKYAKPHPAIFIKTAQKLGFKTDEIVVFEDTIHGIIAAKAARMKAVAVPGISRKHDQCFCIADVVIDSLAEFTQHTWETINHI